MPAIPPPETKFRLGPRRSQEPWPPSFSGQAGGQPRGEGAVPSGLSRPSLNSIRSLRGRRPGPSPDRPAKTAVWRRTPPAARSPHKRNPSWRVRIAGWRPPNRPMRVPLGELRSRPRFGLRPDAVIRCAPEGGAGSRHRLKHPERNPTGPLAHSCNQADHIRCSWLAAAVQTGGPHHTLVARCARQRWVGPFGPVGPFGLCAVTDVLMALGGGLCQRRCRGWRGESRWCWGRLAWRAALLVLAAGAAPRAGATGG